MSGKHRKVGHRVAVAGASLALLALSAQGAFAASAREHVTHQLALIQTEIALDPEAADELAPLEDELQTQVEVYVAEDEAAQADGTDVTEDDSLDQPDESAEPDETDQPDASAEPEETDQPDASPDAGSGGDQGGSGGDHGGDHGGSSGDH